MFWKENSCTQKWERSFKNGFNPDQVMKGNNCRGKLLFFSFSCKIVENVHLQLSTMLKGGWNKEFDDLQFLHLFCDFSASQMWSEIILQIKKVQNSACAFYFSMSTIRINTIFLFRIWDNSSIFFCSNWPST